jgi:hypothetical protein
MYTGRDTTLKLKGCVDWNKSSIAELQRLLYTCAKAEYLECTVKELKKYGDVIKYCNQYQNNEGKSYKPRNQIGSK